MVTKSDPGRRVVVLGTGGTIAGRAGSVGDNVGYSAAQVGIEDLVRHLDLPVDITLVCEQLAQVDSKDMTFAVWQALAARCAHWLAQADVQGVVITHGTDTLEETAFFLQSVLSPGKPVVITCSMRPASALVPDGPQNLRDAIAVVASDGARGVTVVCAGTVHGALEVRKVHTYRLDAFTSGDSGPLAYVEEGALRRLRDWPDGDDAVPTLLTHVVNTDPAFWPWVEILTSHAGARGDLIDVWVEMKRTGARNALQGLVLAATGNGTLHADLEAAALRAQSEGVAVVRATRCEEGRILGLPGAPLRHAGGLTPVKARIALMLELLPANPKD